MRAENRKYSILFRVAVFFLIGILVTGFLTYFTETQLYNNSVTKQTELHAAQIAEETRQAVTEHPACLWLIRYWYAHSDSLDIEYDAPFSAGSRTAEKVRLFSEKHPELQLRYLEPEQCGALPEEDQKLFAEIAYSWLITRINQIKQSYQADYLFCVISEEPFRQQFFLFSGAAPGTVRGTSYEEVYPLGHVVEVAESQTLAMRSAVEHSSHLANAGNYMDYYTALCTFDGHSVLIGLTFNLSDLREDVKAQTRTGANLAILTQLTLSLICLALIFAFVLHPLKKLQTIIRGYKQTKDSAGATAALGELHTQDEIGQLAGDLSELVLEIDSHVEKIRAITAEKERIGTELALARRIQATMLPSSFPAFPERKEFDVYATMDPAKEVGGDFYDFFLIDEDHLALVIADVSGKGVPAALFMMVSEILVKNHAMSGLSPAQILEAINRQICANNPQEMFVTVWLGILEISTGRITAVNAGHEYPTLMQEGSFRMVKDRHGFVVGGMDSSRYREYELRLKPGDKLFVYSDGVPEATADGNRMFGTEQMLRALNADPQAPPEQILKNVRSAVDAFVQDAEQFDDMTMLCLEYRGRRESKNTAGGD